MKWRALSAPLIEHPSAPNALWILNTTPDVLSLPSVSWARVCQELIFNESLANP